MSHCFRLAPNTRLILQRGDITRFVGDALVNAANQRMLGGGGVDGAIHQAAGPELRAACERVPEVRPGVRCPTGQACLTPGAFGSLRVRHIIHAVGPMHDSSSGASAALLRSAYRSSLGLANQHKLKQIAFPAISCGVYGYPLDEAAEVAVTTCKEAAGALEEIHFFLFGQAEIDAWLRAVAHQGLETCRHSWVQESAPHISI